MRAVACLALVLVLGLADGALAAKKAKPKPEPQPAVPKMEPMRFTVVRHSGPGCEPYCAEWIAADGDVVDGSAAELKKVLKSLGKRKLPVVVNSRGGAIGDAIEIGKLIREKGLDVAVARTELEPCAKGVPKCKDGRAPAGSRGRPVSYQAFCASACSIILAGGVRRLVSTWSGLGVHEITVFETQIRVRRTYRVETRTDNRGRVRRKKTLLSEKRIGSKTRERKATDKTYDPVEEFFIASGVDASIMPLMRGTPNSGIHWMTPDEQRSTRMTTDFVGAAYLVAEAEAMAAEAAPVAAGAGTAGGLKPATKAIALGPYILNEATAIVTLERRGAGGAYDILIGLEVTGTPISSSLRFARLSFPGERQLVATGQSADPLAPLAASVPQDWLCDTSGQAATIRITLGSNASPSSESELPTIVNLSQLEGAGALLAPVCPIRQVAQ